MASPAPHARAPPSRVPGSAPVALELEQLGSSRALAQPRPLRSASAASRSRDARSARLVRQRWPRSALQLIEGRCVVAGSAAVSCATRASRTARLAPAAGGRRLDLLSSAPRGGPRVARRVATRGQLVAPRASGVGIAAGAQTRSVADVPSGPRVGVSLRRRVERRQLGLERRSSRSARRRRAAISGVGLLARAARGPLRLVETPRGGEMRVARGAEPFGRGVGLALGGASPRPRVVATASASSRRRACAAGRGTARRVATAAEHDHPRASARSPSAVTALHPGRQAAPAVEQRGRRLAPRPCAGTRAERPHRPRSTRPACARPPTAASAASSAALAVARRPGAGGVRHPRASASSPRRVAVRPEQRPLQLAADHGLDRRPRGLRARRPRRAALASPPPSSRRPRRVPLRRVARRARQARRASPEVAPSSSTDSCRAPSAVGLRRVTLGGPRPRGRPPPLRSRLRDRLRSAPAAVAVAAAVSSSTRTPLALCRRPARVEPRDRAVSSETRARGCDPVALARP